MQAPRALSFVVLLGVVSLFADMTYEGARSATGPFLATLGASAFWVAFVSGGGELVGYVLRLWSGRLADRTRRYWRITAVGYAINLLAVPLLALAGHWPTAALLIVVERAGKALRTPARDAMLSYATTTTGRGWGFGLHEALDQVGATLGPLLVAAVALRSGGYRPAFAVLLVPALAALVTLAASWRMFPRPESLEPVSASLSSEGLPRRYWVHVAASCLVAAGYADFPLLAYHFGQAGIVPLGWIPALYGLAMGVDAVAALVFGRWFDRVGIRVLVVSTVLSAFYAPLAFGNTIWLAVAGAVLWGIGMGAQESIMRAAVAEMIPAERRGTAYGVFNTAYGVSWFLGSLFMGWLYLRSRGTIAGFSVLVQVAAAPCFFLSGRGRERRGTEGS
jgi:MFS family permease